MTKDRLRKDYDDVENLSDLIEAREERDSASADDVDAMEDIDSSGLPTDAVDELTWPHPHGISEEEGSEGTNVNLMDTPDEKDIGFDWQDSLEEMLPTDPEPDEGMGEDAIIEPLTHVEAAELPESEEWYGFASGTSEEYEAAGAEPPRPPVPVEIESAMETDSDEEAFTIEDKFEGQMDRETALLEFEEMRHAEEEESKS